MDRQIPLLQRVSLVVMGFVLIFSFFSFASADDSTWITVDDSNVGFGLNQFNYVGFGWQHCTNCGAMYDKQTNTWTTTPNDSLTFTFTGTQLKFFGGVNKAGGQAAVSVDGGTPTTIDFYAQSAAGNTLLWTSPILSAATHTFALRVLSTHNAKSSGTGVVVDRIDILSSASAQPQQTVTPCPTNGQSAPNYVPPSSYLPGAGQELVLYMPQKAASTPTPSLSTPCANSTQAATPAGNASKHLCRERGVGPLELCLDHQAAITSTSNSNAAPLIANASNVSAANLTLPMVYEENINGQSQIFEKYPDGSVINLSHNSFNDSTPAMSPNGTTIAFESNRSGLTQIWTMDIDGHTLHQITTGNNTNYDPAWSPDGSKIAFSSNRDGASSFNIYVVNANGSNAANPLRLTFGTGLPTTDVTPTWSNNGLIAFESDRGCACGIVGIWVVNATNGSNLQQLTNNNDGEPAWSSDSSTIAFESFRDGQGEIYSIAVNSNGTAAGNPVRLTSIANLNVANAYPGWATNGYIVFSSATGLNPYNLFIMAKDGTNVQQLTTGTNNDAEASLPVQPQPYCFMTVTAPDGRYLRSRPISNTSFAYTKIPSGSKALAISSYINPNYDSDGIPSNDTEVWIETVYNNQVGWILAADTYNNPSGTQNTYVDSTGFSCITNSATLPPHTFAYKGASINWAQTVQLQNIAGASGSLAYLYSHESGALLLARLAIAESPVGFPLDEYYAEADDVAWTVRVRAFIGWINYSGGTLTASGLPNLQATGMAGNSVPVAEDLIYGASNYQPMTNFQQGISSQNIQLAFYPKSDFDLEDLYQVYLNTQMIINADWRYDPTQKNPTLSYESYYNNFSDVPSTYVRPTYRGYTMSPQKRMNPNATDASKPTTNNVVRGNWWVDKKVIDNYFYDCLSSFIANSTNPMSPTTNQFPRGPFKIHIDKKATNNEPLEEVPMFGSKNQCS